MKGKELLKNSNSRRLMILSDTSKCITTTMLFMKEG